MGVLPTAAQLRLGILLYQSQHSKKEENRSNFNFSSSQIVRKIDWQRKLPILALTISNVSPRGLYPPYLVKLPGIEAGTFLAVRTTKVQLVSRKASMLSVRESIFRLDSKNRPRTAKLGRSKMCENPWSYLMGTVLKRDSINQCLTVLKREGNNMIKTWKMVHKIEFSSQS